LPQRPAPAHYLGTEADLVNLPCAPTVEMYREIGALEQKRTSPRLRLNNSLNHYNFQHVHAEHLVASVVSYEGGKVEVGRRAHDKESIRADGSIFLAGNNDVKCVAPAAR
jgi:hypothetical protein